MTPTILDDVVKVAPLVYGAFLYPVYKWASTIKKDVREGKEDRRIIKVYLRAVCSKLHIDCGADLDGKEKG